MAKASFKDFGIEVEAGVSDDASDSATPAPVVDFSQMKKGFMLSRIDVGHQLKVANDDGIDPEAIHRELSKTGINIVAFNDEEREKFGLVDHPLHVKHMESMNKAA